MQHHLEKKALKLELIRRVTLTHASEVACLLKVGPSGLESLS